MEALESGPYGGTKSLGAAKHRFETWARPLAQFVMTLNAIVKTAQDISVLRPGTDEGTDAETFLTVALGRTGAPSSNDGRRSR